VTPTTASGPIVRLEELFPSPLWIGDLDALAPHNGAMLAYLEALRQSDAGLRRANVLGWHSPDDLHRLAVFAPLRDVILSILDSRVASALKLDLVRHRLCLSSMWGMWYPKFGHAFLHRHPHSLFSGVYYLTCEGGSGTLRFHDPRADVRMLRPPVLEEVSYTLHIKEYVPKAGRLLLFPSWLPHDVTPNLSDEPRVAISFNVVAERRVDAEGAASGREEAHGHDHDQGHDHV